jgi:DNA-binding transcriptional LysR family regulator
MTMDRLTAMEVSVRVGEAGSFAGAEDCSASDSPQSPRPLLSSTWSFLSGTAEETVMLNGGLRTTAAEGLREAVFAGLGLCVASEWMFQRGLDTGRVKQVLPAWALPPMDLWAVFPTGRRASAKAGAFAAFIENQLRVTNFGE